MTKGTIKAAKADGDFPPLYSHQEATVRCGGRALARKWPIPLAGLEGEILAGSRGDV